jgi:hypothetical protein
MPNIGDLPSFESISNDDYLLVEVGYLARKMRVAEVTVGAHALPLSDLETTGVPGPDTYLRGDGHWNEISVPSQYSKMSSLAYDDWRCSTTHDDTYFSYLLKLCNANQDVPYYCRQETIATCDPYEYMGGCLTLGGNIFLCPYNGTKARVIDPVTLRSNYISGFSSIPSKYFGAVLLKSGQIFCFPYAEAKAALCSLGNETITHTSCEFSYPCRGGIVMDNGEVLCVPSSTAYGAIEIYNADTDTLRSVTGVPPDTEFWGACSLSNHRYLICPAVGQQGLIYDLVANTLTFTDLFETVPVISRLNGAVTLVNGLAMVLPHEGSQAFTCSASGQITALTFNSTNEVFSGGVTLPNGDVMGVPFNSHLLKFFRAETNIVTTLTLSEVLSGYSGGLLLKDGNVVLLPFSSAKVTRLSLAYWWNQLPSLRFLTNPIINKL